MQINPKSTLSVCEAQLPEECKHLDPEVCVMSNLLLLIDVSERCMELFIALRELGQAAHIGIELHSLQDPRCAKLTIAGEILKVPDEEVEVARDLMFRRHRQMRDWHTHKFTL